MRKRDGIFWDICAEIFGSLLFALGVDIFTAPNNIAPGGVTGIATMLNDLTGLPIGITSLLLNLPLILLGWKFLGKKFIHSTLRTLLILTTLTDMFAVFLPKYTGNMLLASIFGGLLIVALLTNRAGVTDPLAPWLLLARVIQSCAHLSSLSVMAVNVRFAAFAAQMAIALYWCAALLR